MLTRVFWSEPQQKDGSSASNAVSSCLAIFDAGLSHGDGIYWLTNPAGSPFQAYCDMTTGGGGWTLVMRIAADGVLGYSATYWTNGALLNESPSSSLTPTDAFNAKFQSYLTTVGSIVRGCLAGTPNKCVQVGRLWDHAADLLGDFPFRLARPRQLDENLRQQHLRAQLQPQRHQPGHPQRWRPFRARRQ